jgi:hypothetical protein
MRKLFGGLVVVMLGLAASPAGAAGWVPGTPWSTCSAPRDCSSTLYVRRIDAVHAVWVPYRHVRSVHRVHARPVRHRTVRRVAVHHRNVRTDEYARGFQYITDPREAAVAAWADIANN